MTSLGLSFAVASMITTIVSAIWSEIKKPNVIDGHYIATEVLFALLFLVCIVGMIWVAVIGMIMAWPYLVPSCMSLYNYATSATGSRIVRMWMIMTLASIVIVTATNSSPLPNPSRSSTTDPIAIINNGHPPCVTSDRNQGTPEIIVNANVTVEPNTTTTTTSAEAFGLWRDFLTSRHESMALQTVEISSKLLMLMTVGIPYSVTVDIPWRMVSEVYVMFLRFVNWLHDVVTLHILRSLQVSYRALERFINIIADNIVYPIGRLICTCLLTVILPIVSFVWSCINGVCFCIYVFFGMMWAIVGSVFHHVSLVFRSYIF